METQQPTSFNSLKKTFVGLDSQIDHIQEIIIGLQNKNVALLGIPGTGKTKLAQAIGKMISHGSTFYDGEWTATSTPSHFLGPQSFPSLMEKEELVHNTTGYPPDCEVWHAEEGFKAQGPLLDLLLPFGEDRKYMNGKRECHAKTVVWLVSSNELPNEANGALCDRFAIVFFPRLTSIVDRFAYSKKMSGGNYDVLDGISENPRWSVEKIKMYHDIVKDIEIPDYTIMAWDGILEGIRTNLTRGMETVRASVEETFYRGNMQERGMATGRGHRLGLMLAKARAFTEGSRKVEPQHLCAAMPVLVVDPEFRDGVEKVVQSFAIPTYATVLSKANKAVKEADNIIMKQFDYDSQAFGFKESNSETTGIDPSVFRDCLKAITDAQDQVDSASEIYTIHPRLPGRKPDGTFAYSDERSVKPPKDMIYLKGKLDRYHSHISGLMTQSLALNEG